MTQETQQKIYWNDVTWMAIASYPEEPIRGTATPKFVQGLAPVMPGYTREATEMMAILGIIGENPDAHIPSMIKWPHPYVFIVRVHDFFGGDAYPMAFDARTISGIRAGLSGMGSPIATRIYGQVIPDYPDWMLDKLIGETIDHVKDSGEPDMADALMGAILGGPTESLTDRGAIMSFDDLARQFYRLPKPLVEKMTSGSRIIWASEWHPDEFGTDVTWSKYRRTRYPVDRLRPFISPDFEMPWPASELSVDWQGVPSDIMTAAAESPDEQAFVQKVDEVVQAVQDSVKAHSGEMARAATQVTRDVAKDLGYDSVPQMLAEGVRGVLKRTKFDRMLDWAHGKVAGLFEPKIEVKELPWRERKK